MRIQVLRALARIPTARSAELALRAFDQGPVEGFLEYALWLTINDLAEPWATAVESGAWKIEGREKQLQYALKAIEPKLATKLMAKVIGDKPIPRDGSGGMIELIGQAGSSMQLRLMFDQVLTGGFNDEGAIRALNSLIEAARLRNVRPSGDPTMISKLLDSPNESIRASAAKLTGSWKLASMAPALNKLASDASASANLRRSAIEGLRELGGKDAVASLRALAKDKDDSVRRSSVAALAATDLNGSMPQILEVVSATTKEDDALALWRSFLSAKGASAALARALAKTSLPEVVARAGVRVAREGGRNEPDLILALNRAGSLTDESHALTEEEIHRIAYDVTRGDPARGELVYRRKELGCVICHAIGGAGGKVGPDMTSLGASAVTDYIVESVLVPNKKVKEGFHSIQVATKDGQEFSGILVRESTEELILRDATNKEISVPKKGIESQRIGGSIMPSGLADILSPGERLDLFQFLTQLGKPGPFDATKGNVARVWKVRAGASNVEQFGAEPIVKSDLNSAPWVTMYSTVNGNLPKTDLETEMKTFEHRGVVSMYAASQLQLSREANVRFKVELPADAAIWIDGKPVSAGSEVSAQLSAGLHTITFRLDAKNPPTQIRVEASEGTFLLN